MAGWVGKYYDVITVVIPYDGLAALHGLLFAHSVGERKRTLMFALADSRIPPVYLLRYLPRGSSVKRTKLPPDPLYIKQEVFHLARNSDLVASPIAFDAEGLGAEVLFLGTDEAPAFPGWRPLPLQGQDRLVLTPDVPVAQALTYLSAAEVEVLGTPVPEGVVFCRGQRVVKTPTRTYPPTT